MIGMIPLSMPISTSDPYRIGIVIEVLTERGFEIKQVFGEWVYTPHPEADLQPILSFTITGVEAEKEVVIDEDEHRVKAVKIDVCCREVKCVVDLEEYEKDLYGVSSVLKSKRIKVCSCRRRAPVKVLEKALDTLLSVYEKQSVGTQQSL